MSKTTLYSIGKYRLASSFNLIGGYTYTVEIKRGKRYTPLYKVGSVDEGMSLMRKLVFGRDDKDA